MRKRTVLATLTTASTLVVSVLAVPPSAQGATPRSIPNTKPAWTGHARHLGHAADSGRVHARVYLAPRGGMSALTRQALAVSTPGNAAYGKFLTPAQFYARYAPTAATVHTISSWLRAGGLKVTGVAAHNRFVSVTGSVKAAEHAFSASIDRYRIAGATVQAPAATLKAPAGLVSSILTVTGLNTRPSVVHPASKPAGKPGAGFRNAPPCSKYFGEKTATTLPAFGGAHLPYAPCGYIGAQYRSAYEGDTGLDGSGITVAITDAYASPTIVSDATTYAANHGDRTYVDGQLTQVLPKNFTHRNTCGESGWYGEETLDVEAVHAMAPGANIRYYGGASCYDKDLLDTLTTVVDEDKAQLVSNSWGDAGEQADTETVRAYTAIFAQGAVEGISFLYSSGDSGDEVANTGTKQADDPATNPYVTAVGGTADGIGPEGTMQFQTGWGTVKYSLSSDKTSWNEVGFMYGAGGGTSRVWDQPDYQKGVAPAGGRQVPDVGMDADPTTGMLVGQTQSFPDGVYYDEYRIGGTSLASPLFAGFTALALQRAGGKGVGLLNPTIYARRAAPAFNDVNGNPGPAGAVRADYANGVDASSGIVYSVRTFNEDSSLDTGPGWDFVTGVGSPNASYVNLYKH